MFTEIKKLIAKRSLTITVSMLDNVQIRVNVVPHARPEDKKVNEQLSYSSKNEVASVPEEAIKALTTPLSITGTAEEVDEKLPGVLLQYVDSHGQLQNSLDQASNEIAEAVKAIDERNKAKAKEKTLRRTTSHRKKNRSRKRTTPCLYGGPTSPPRPPVCSRNSRQEIADQFLVPVVHRVFGRRARHENDD